MTGAITQTLETALDKVLIVERREMVAQIDQAKAEMAVAKAAEVALGLRLEALEQSTSWRLTVPVRFVGNQIKSVQHVVRFTASAVRAAGGPAKATRRAFSILRQEGFQGVKQRISQLRQADKPGRSYSEWIKLYDTIDDVARVTIRADIEQMSVPPKISVLMPVYNPPPDFLDEAIRSVRQQLYENWELCIADDASTDETVTEVLRRHAAQDGRIRLTYRPINGHICAASNSALELVSGEFVALLDHDDVLPEHALYCVAKTILGNPDAGLIYSDEDKLDELGVRQNPYFKCDFNPELLYFQNMISHLSTYRTNLIREIGGFRVGLEGSQDYDLALRCIERLRPEQIIHIPRVLYHWRIHSASTAAAADTKPYALLAGVRAVNEHFYRTGINARAALDELSFFHKVQFFLPKHEEPTVSIIIPTRNGKDLVSRCIESILTRSSYEHFEIILVDNGSDDPGAIKFFNELGNDPRIQILRDNRPFNYSILNNTAARRARGDLLCLLNNDTEVLSRDWLQQMASLAIRPEIGAVGARLWYPNDTLQHGGVIVGLRGVAGHAFTGLPKGHAGYFNRALAPQSFTALTAACLMVRKSIFDEMGGLDEALAVAFGDTDFCLRIRQAGYRNVWTPNAELYHHESASRGREDTPEKLDRFQNESNLMRKRWRNELANDPAYSPNLTLNRADFSLAWPPRVARF